MSQEVDEGQSLRENLFQADLLQLPAPEEGIPGFLPEWYQGTLPTLVYPPLSERGLQDGDNVNLEVTPYHLYYGALRELAETADAERAEVLRRLVTEWNADAAMEVCQLARLHVETDAETALLHYELALEINPELYEATQDAGMCEFALSNQNPEEREERAESAEELFRRAIELRPEAGLSWWSLARVLHDRGEQAEAQAVLLQFLQQFPEGEQREMVEAALQTGFQAEQVSPEQAAFQQAQAMAFGDDPQGAVELLQPLAQAYPDTGEIWFVLGAAHRRSGNAEEAERCLRRAARLAPAEPFVWWELSRAYADEQQWSAAEDAVRRALEVDPENAIYLCDLARALLAQGNRDEAEEAVQKAYDLVPDDPMVLETRELLGGPIV